MVLPHVQFTVGRMMIAVASIGLILGALRAGYPACAGILIIATCIGWLTHQLSSESLSRMSVEGMPLGLSRKLEVILGSMGHATAIMLASDFAFLVVYSSYMSVRSFGRHHFHLHLQSKHIAIGTVLGALAAISVASRMGQIIRRKHGLLDNIQPSTSVQETPPEALENCDA